MKRLALGKLWRSQAATKCCSNFSTVKLASLRRFNSSKIGTGRSNKFLNLPSEYKSARYFNNIDFPEPGAPLTTKRRYFCTAFSASIKERSLVLKAFKET